MYYRLWGVGYGQIFPSGVNSLLFWEDTNMSIWLLKGKIRILECRNSDSAITSGSAVMYSSHKKLFLSKVELQLCILFSIGKCFIFEKDLAFRVSHSWKIVDVLIEVETGSWVQRAALEIYPRSG